MELSYVITPDNYSDLLEFLQRENDARPVKQLMFLLTTVGQSALVLWYLLSAKLSPIKCATLICASLALTIGQIAYRKSRRLRAVFLTNEMEKNGRIQKSYWGWHSLRLENGILICSYANVTNKADCRNLTRIGKYNATTFLFCGRDVFELIPSDLMGVSEFLSRVDEETFRDRREYIHNKKKELVESGTELISLELGNEERCRYLAGLKRNGFLTAHGWKPTDVVRVALSLFLVGFSLYGGNDAPSVLMSLVLALLLSFPVWMCFTPLYARMMSDGGNAASTVNIWAVQDGVLYHILEKEIREYPISDICTVVRRKDCIYFYSRQWMTFIPNRAAEKIVSKIRFYSPAAVRSKL